jgi:hypothetical protein
MKKLWIGLSALAALAWVSLPVAGQQNLDPLIVDPQHYHLEFENQYVKIIRCRIAAHDQVKMHHHPVGSVVILITDQNLKQTEADGKVGEAHRKAGAAFWADPTTHMGQNISDRPYEYVRVDIKAAVH